MKPTRAPVLFLLAGFGAAAGWLLETAMVAMGRAIAIPPATLSIALVLIAIIIVGMALPVFRVVRGTARKAVDPFYATRVVLLAKASSLAGALLAGGTLAVLGFVLSRSIVPAVGSVATTIAAAACAIVLLIAGLVAEKMCTLPPQGDDPTSTATGKD
ncbi:DUF3180 domain-containing protein [Glaciihabitans arcticus]|uniref:DUF3180 domain-containing protein n=1 Tax=Glaciihabitans arcticus TaxID=2668039 RepID=A0A4Q9GWJ4_9MICO|nr:DUF3180 domain-containing protein [Glaciihabitans arcticus]TBN57968.1 DUF3180 domain-containing protein [Glaciihabitans arcticus]